MNTDHLFITRDEIQKLVTLLREIPEIVEELAVTLTRQDCLGKGGAKVSMGEREQPLPFNVNASEVSDDLHNTLVGWVRHVCESRVLDYTGSTSTIGLARWLDRNVIALAMSEGSGTALDEVQYAMRRARWATDRPDRPDSTWVDPGVLEEARSAIGTAADLEKILRGMGDPTLTRKRITYLDRLGELSRITLPDGTTVFTVGDVLDAHARRTKGRISA